MRRTNTLTPEIESEIRSAVGGLLERNQSRSELTREVATLLFFKYGIHPSANTVHSYTRYGSLTDINNDLKKFWETLRHRFQTTVPGVELPSDLLEQTGELLNKLWSLAVKKADDSTQAIRTEALAEVKLHLDERLKLESELAENKLISEKTIQDITRLREQAEKEMNSALVQLEIEKREKEDAIRNIFEAEKKAAQERSSRELSEQRFSESLERLEKELQRQTEQLNGDLNFAKRQIDDAREVTRNQRTIIDELKKEKESFEKTSHNKIVNLQIEINKLKELNIHLDAQLSSHTKEKINFTNQISIQHNKIESLELMLQETQNALISAYKVIESLSDNRIKKVDEDQSKPE